jgi:glyoxylase-like metal-dependent hydrolase (beta-lactamase superfamily II)
MELNKINGSTYYIDNATNIGVYVFKNKYCLLVDTGINNTLAGKFDELLRDAGLKPKYIVNTHNHIDHSGANIYFKEHHPGTIFYASRYEKLFLENDFLFPVYISGSGLIKELKGRNSKNRGVNVDTILETGINKIDEEKFDIISLKGHSIGQIGVGTQDRVCFLGDSLFSDEIMTKYPFPFLYDIENQFYTIETIKALDFDYFLLSHSGKVYSRDEIVSLADRNKDNLNKHIEDMKVLLQQPLTREELLEQIVVLNNMELSFRDYYLCLSSAGSFIAYLYNTDLLSFDIENGRLYYYIK